MKLKSLPPRPRNLETFKKNTFKTNSEAGTYLG